MTVHRGGSRGSLAVRLIGLYTLGALLVFALLGTSLTMMLRSELQARDLTELDGKSIVVEHHLLDVRTGHDLSRSLSRFVDTSVGHDNLQLGVMVGGTWLLRPGEGVGELLDGRSLGSIPTGDGYATLRDAGRTWWLRRVARKVDGLEGGEVHAIVAVDVTHSQLVRDRFGVAMAMIGSTGILLMAALAWWATRSALAPLERVAKDAQRVTAQRLGEPLLIDEAPEEIRGVVAGINAMLSRLDESFRSLEQFSADIAHELRTPLNSMLLRVEVTLSRERPGTEYRDALHETMQELGHLQKMVSDMLFIARAERGLAALQVDQVDLLAEVQNVVEYFEPLAGDRRLSTSVQGQATIKGDRSMIRRVVTNLLSNAVRYALPDSTITVNLASDDEAVRMTVANRCEPLTQEQAARMFDRFARGERAREDQPDGAGLGLAIVRSVMALHGGEVAARTEGDEIAIVARWPRPDDASPRPAARALVRQHCETVMFSQWCSALCGSDDRTIATD